MDPKVNAVLEQVRGALEEEDKTPVHIVLSVLGKKAKYEKHTETSDQEQWWFWASEVFYANAMRVQAISDAARENVWRKILNRVRKKLPVGFIAVVRDPHVVVVREKK